MCACITDFFDLEELAEELVGHGADHLVQEQVLVDRIQVCLYSKASGLNVLADYLDIL